MTTRQARPQLSPAGPQPAHAGVLLQRWRHTRRRSQLDLALEAGVSARHLSFVETGRSTPSRQLLLALADELEVPLRERNSLMLAAGYAPAYAETDLHSSGATAAREALAHLLAGHEPYPAVVLDRWGDVVLANGAIGPLLEDVNPALLTPPINVYRLSLHSDGLAPRIINHAEWAAHLGHRLTRLARLTGDDRLAQLLEEIRGYPGVAAALDDRHEPVSRGLMLALHLAHPRGEMALHSTVTSFGSAGDVTLSELALETFFPATASTRELLHQMLPAPGAEQHRTTAGVD